MALAGFREGGEIVVAQAFGSRVSCLNGGRSIIGSLSWFGNFTESICVGSLFCSGSLCLEFNLAMAVAILPCLSVSAILHLFYCLAASEDFSVSGDRGEDFNQFD